MQTISWKQNVCFQNKCAHTYLHTPCGFHSCPYQMLLLSISHCWKLFQIKSQTNEESYALLISHTSYNSAGLLGLNIPETCLSFRRIACQPLLSFYS